MGAAAVLLYGAPSAPLAQPRNVLLGNLIGSVVGVSFGTFMPINLHWLGGALAVSVSLACMHVVKAVHPPGGATALIAAFLGGARAEGYLFVASTMVGYVVMIIVALLVDNVARSVSYPRYWW